VTTAEPKGARTGGAEDDRHVTVDGSTFEAEPGELLIKAAQDNGSTSRASAGTSA